MYERFNENAIEVMKLAEQEARKNGDEYLGMQHIFKGILEGKGIGLQAIKNFGIDIDMVKKRLEDIFSKDEFDEPKKFSGITESVKKLPKLSKAYAQNLNQGDTIGTGHILYTALGEKYGPVAVLLEDVSEYKVNRDMIRDEITSLLTTGKSSLPSKILDKDGKPHQKAI